jgi:hypothetical protein
LIALPKNSKSDARVVKNIPFNAWLTNWGIDWSQQPKSELTLLYSFRRATKGPIENVDVLHVSFVMADGLSNIYQDLLPAVIIASTALY